MLFVPVEFQEFCSITRNETKKIYLEQGDYWNWRIWTSFGFWKKGDLDLSVLEKFLTSASLADRTMDVLLKSSNGAIEHEQPLSVTVGLDRNHGTDGTKKYVMRVNAVKKLKTSINTTNTERR